MSIINVFKSQNSILLRVAFDLRAKITHGMTELEKNLPKDFLGFKLGMGIKTGSIGRTTIKSYEVPDNLDQHLFLMKSGKKILPEALKEHFGSVMQLLSDVTNTPVLTASGEIFKSPKNGGKTSQKNISWSDEVEEDEKNKKEKDAATALVPEKSVRPKTLKVETKNSKSFLSVAKKGLEKKEDSFPKLESKDTVDGAKSNVNNDVTPDEIIMSLRSELELAQTDNQAIISENVHLRNQLKEIKAEYIEFKSECDRKDKANEDRIVSLEKEIKDTATKIKKEIKEEYEKTAKNMEDKNNDYIQELKEENENSVAELDEMSKLLEIEKEKISQLENSISTGNKRSHPLVDKSVALKFWNMSYSVNSAMYDYLLTHDERKFRNRLESSGFDVKNWLFSFHISNADLDKLDFVGSTIETPIVCPGFTLYRRLED